MAVHVLTRGTRRFSINDATNTSPFVNTIMDDWLRRLNLGGVTASLNTFNTMLTFVKGLYDTNLYSYMVNVNCFVPDNLTAALTPIIAINGSGSSGFNGSSWGNSWANSGFTNTALNGSGIGGDITHYLRTGVIPSTHLSQDSCGLTLYCSSGDTNNLNDFGAFNAAAGGFQLLPNYANTAYFQSMNGSAGSITGTPLTNGQGFTSGNRLDVNTEYLYKASSTVAFTQIAGPGGNGAGTVPYEVYCLAANDRGSPFGASAKRFSFAAIHRGMISTQVQTFYNLVQQMRTNLGGGYV